MTLLLLAGTREARTLAGLLAECGVPTLASLAGTTRTPKALPVATRIGGFGGVAGFEACLDDRQITAVLNATHPFAEAMDRRTAAICAARGLPCLRLLRPAWRAGPSDVWHAVRGLAHVAQALPVGARAFLATGPGSLGAVGPVPRAEAVFCRRIDPPTESFPWSNGDWIVGRPGISAESEARLFEDLSITHLVTKNAGGQDGEPKLRAAQALRLPVIMVERPRPAPGQRVETVEEALQWAMNPF